MNPMPDLKEEGETLVVYSIGDPSKPSKTSEPSRSDIGKARKLYFTRTLPKVVKCGHKFDLGAQPKYRNCESCWFAWFSENGEVTQGAEEMLALKGPEHIVSLQGKKFTHRLRQYLSTIAQGVQK